MNEDDYLHELAPLSSIHCRCYGITQQQLAVRIGRPQRRCILPRRRPWHLGHVSVSNRNRPRPQLLGARPRPVITPARFSS